VNTRPEIPAFFLALVLIVGIVILLGLGVAIPTWLVGLLLALVAGGLGITVPASSSSAAPGAPQPATVAPGAGTPTGHTASTFAGTQQAVGAPNPQPVIHPGGAT